MSNRFDIIYSLPTNMYCEKSPVIISAGALLLDKQTKNVLVQMRIKNISNKIICGIKVELSPLELNGEKKYDSISYQYLDIKCKRNEEIGNKIPVFIRYSTTRKFSVEHVEVIFSDGKLWRNEEVKWTSIGTQDTVHNSLDPELIEQFHFEYGAENDFIFREKNDLWNCVCGTYNRNDESICSNCGKSLEEVGNFSIAKLRNNLEIRKKEQENEEKRVKALKIVQRKRWTRRVLFSVPLIVAFTVVICFAYNQYENRKKYFEATSLMEQGNYKEAFKIFDALGEYRDSEEKCQIAEEMEMETMYQNAIEFRNNFEYQKAIDSFIALKSYKDSYSLLYKTKIEYGEYLIQLKRYFDAKLLFENLNEEYNCEEQIQRIDRLILADEVKASKEYLKLRDEILAEVPHSSISYDVDTQTIMMKVKCWEWGDDIAEYLLDGMNLKNVIETFNRANALSDEMSNRMKRYPVNCSVSLYLKLNKESLYVVTNGQQTGGLLEISRLKNDYATMQESIYADIVQWVQEGEFARVSNYLNKKEIFPLMDGYKDTNRYGNYAYTLARFERGDAVSLTALEEILIGYVPSGYSKAPEYYEKVKQLKESLLGTYEKTKGTLSYYWTLHQENDIICATSWTNYKGKTVNEKGTLRCVFENEEFKYAELGGTYAKYLFIGEEENTIIISRQEEPEADQRDMSLGTFIKMEKDV